MKINDFFLQLEAIPWFQNIGKKVDNLTQIQEWDEWPGPAEPPIEALHLEQQTFYDNIMSRYSSKQNELKSIFNQISNHTIELSRKALNHALDGDSWDPISMAGRHAAWTAGLYVLSAYLEIKLPGNIEEQWEWFCKGHWPCAYKRLDKNDLPEELIIL